MNNVQTYTDTMLPESKDRAQKIVAALFLLTNHIDIEHPLRRELRTSATAFLKSVLLGADVTADKASIMSLIEVLVLMKEIKKENADIISQQLELFHPSKTITKETIISDMFVTMPDAVHQAQVNGSVSETKTSSVVQRPIPQVAQVAHSVSFEKPALSTPTIPYAPYTQRQVHASSEDIKEQDQTMQTQNKKDEKKIRRERVLSLLSKTDVRSIKDIAPHFTDCSEKTIQRDLNDLVDEKKIVRVGDRRWSTYKLA